jgi:Dolichyl-phosphate-mannose-protein mannosyltransferase
MRTPTNPRTLWPTLVLVSGVPRIVGAFFLPNAFGDAYVYIRDIGSMSTKISRGTFALTDLYGFWLPLYQFISALINVFVRNGFYAGKIVSAIFGVGACLLIYSITLRLTASHTAALLGFLLIALNPLHIDYSASAMTDVPQAFFVLASLYFVLQRGWVFAAVFAALAGLTRVESWMLIALIPLIQFIRERRISITALLILIIPPLFWFYISWKATGNWLACFESRQQYHDWLLAMNPALAHFSLSNVLRDGAILIISTDIAVLIASSVAGWLVARRLPQGFTSKGLPEDLREILAPVVFFFAFLGLLVTAYLTHQQPMIFPRYGLLLFSLGIPILAWTFLRVRQQKPEWARRLLVSVIALCIFDGSIQFVGAVGSLNAISAERSVADYLHAHFDPNSNARIFSDEGTVSVMSGIPEEKFLTSSDTPRDREGFLASLKEKNVEYLVFVSKGDSTPAKLFPELKDGNHVWPFEAMMHSKSQFLRMDIWLYRVRDGAVARP